MCTLRLSRTLKELCVYQDGHLASTGYSAQITFRVNVSHKEEGEVLSTRNPVGVPIISMILSINPKP